ncbi:MAG: hypothetical protein GY801_05025 [bacterium]|nr:hypothetical protein [bacterium]
MKRFSSFFVVLSFFAALTVFAQNEQAPSDSETLKKEKESVAADETAEVATEEESKAPRVYPIAAGLWYPGDPLPEKAFRYYRIRCWPGCHRNSKYGISPDNTSTEHPEKEEKQ